MTTGPTGRFAGSTGTNRTYKRDRDGKFSSGGGGVRDSLAGARDIDALNEAATAEARRVTGRDISFDMRGSDLQTAKEHCEGVMQGLDRYPRANLDRVQVRQLADGVQAHAAGSTIVFNSTYASSPGRATYLDQLERGASGWDKGLETYGISDQKIASWHPRNSDTPIATGLHEFGHVLDIATTQGRTGVAVDQLTRRLTAREQRKQTLPGTPVRDTADFVQRSVSSYARSSRTELIAEAFTDVMLNGASASGLSRGVVDLLESEYISRTGTTNMRNAAASDIDLSRLLAEFEKQLDALLRRWTDITADQRRQIVDQVRVAVTADDLAALAKLHVSTAAGAELLAEAMGQMALDAAKEVVRESAAQGVAIDPVATDRAGFHVVAEALAALLAEGLTNSAGREALRRWSTSTGGDEVAAAVQEHLGSLSDAFVRDNLGGAMMSALTTGRVETMLAAPSAAIYASEWMDKRTCKPCRQINGKWIGNSDDPQIVAKIQAVYPNGGYKDCLGGVRCRGTVVQVYRPDQVAGGPQVTVGT